MERFIPTEVFRKKRNTFQGITFFSVSPLRPQFFVPDLFALLEPGSSARVRHIAYQNMAGSSDSYGIVIPVYTFETVSSILSAAASLVNEDAAEKGITPLRPRFFFL